MVSKCGFHLGRVMISLSIHLLIDKPVESRMAVTLRVAFLNSGPLPSEGITSPCHPLPAWSKRRHHYCLEEIYGQKMGLNTVKCDYLMKKRWAEPCTVCLTRLHTNVCWSRPICSCSRSGAFSSSLYFLEGKKEKDAFTVREIALMTQIALSCR